MKPRKRVIIPGVSIWPQPKTNPRERYKISYVSGGKRKTVTAASDLDTTIDLAREIAKRQERIRLGLGRPITERWSDQDRRSIADHLSDWRSSIEDAGCTPKHVRQFHLCAQAVFFGTAELNEARKRGTKHPELPTMGIGRVSEIVPSLIQRQIAKVKEQRGAATANRYLDAVLAFLNWGVQDTRWERNVCTHLEHYNVEADRKRTRRAISVADVVRVIAAADAGETVEGVSGKERGLLYRVCIATALRSNEIRHMLVHDLVLSGSRLGVWTTAKRAKNRRKIFVELPLAIAEMLAGHVAGKRADEPVFIVPPNTARMLRADLKACEPPIPYRDSRGDVFDFHGLRHECGAILIAAGANAKAVQSHMRHSSIRLTMDTYGHLLDQPGGVAGMLPDLGAQRLAQRETSNFIRSGSPTFAAPKEKPAIFEENRGSEQWSHGESNPDLLNAIQPTDLRKSSVSKGIYRTLTDELAPGAARRATRRIRRAMVSLRRKNGRVR